MEQNGLNPFIFGIYPGSMVGIDAGKGIITGPPDQPALINQALERLQPTKNLFLLRAYIQYQGNKKFVFPTPENFEQFLIRSRKLDLVLCYRANETQLVHWVSFIEQMIEKYGKWIYKIQVTEEPNNPDATSGGEGSFHNIHEALVIGVIAAKRIVSKLGLQIQIGFNATPSFDPTDRFWNIIAKMATFEFKKSLDYVGLDFYPDVFRPLPPGASMRDAVLGVLHHFKNVNLKTGGITSNIPLHITENGWPTNLNRSEEKQSAIIKEVIETIWSVREPLNITSYAFFNLRDSDTNNEELQYGLMRSDYSAKPAFEIYRNLVETLSV